MEGLSTDLRIDEGIGGYEPQVIKNSLECDR